MQTVGEPPTATAYGMGTGIAGREHYFMFHAPLTVYDAGEGLLPRLAEKIPSVQDGDWKLLPDGGMEVTWKLKPNVRWHDGTPLSAEDFVLGFKVAKDPDLALAAVAPQTVSMTEVRAPDDRTIVMVWKELSVYGNVNGHDGVGALPRHIVADLYAGDRAAFENSQYWSTQWVGLCPYRMTRWERGSFIEATAYDDYFLGRPKIGRIIIRYIGDATALVANVLSGDVDVVPSGAQLDVPQMIAIKEAWGRAGTAGQSFASPKGVRTLWLQFRNATPWTQDLRVRQALVHSLDRETLINAMLSGAVPRMDFYIPLESPVNKLAEQRGLPKYPFDAARAQRLLGEAGWTRGPDGLLRNSAGDLFPRIDVASSPSGDNVPEAAAVAGTWSAAGFQSVPAPWSATASNVADVRATHPGAVAFPWNFTNLAPSTLSSERIGTPANRWAGINYGGYSNPDYDRLSAQLQTTLDVSQRQEILFGIVKIIAEEIPIIPIYLVANPSLARAGIEGVGEVPAEQASSTWNIHAWDYK
jgi:peptide/nickel transport system substrate-binding protein